MKNFKRVLSLILSAAIILPFGMKFESAAQSEGELRGLLVNSYQNKDFPSANNLSVKALGEELQNIVNYAQSNSFNSIFFEVRPDDDALYKSKIYPTSDVWVKEKGDFSFFDPSKDMIKRAGKSGLRVYAVINLGFAQESEQYPEKEIEQNLEDFEYISKKYDFAGVVIKNLPKMQDFDYQSFLTRAKTSLGDMKLGVLYKPADFDDKNNETILSNVDFAIPQIDEALGFQGEGYINSLNNLSKINKYIVPISDLTAAENVTPVISSKHFEALSSGYKNYVINSYSDLKNNINMQGSLLFTVSQMSEKVSSVSTSYNPPSKLTITRPTDTIKTAYSTYFIMGTSNPNSPLYFKGAEVERNNSDGMFGVLVNLSFGNNTFTFSQDGITKTVSIVRPQTSSAAVPISKITKAFPNDSAVFNDGEEREISCIAPSGGNVYAVINDKTVQLTQNAAASNGVPALYTGKVSLSGSELQQTKSIGNIVYYLNYNGTQSSFTPNGKVYLRGAEAKTEVKVTTTFASVLTSDLKYGEFKSIYKEGTTDEVVDMEFANSAWYYLLKSGGYINCADVEVLESDSNSDIKQLERAEFLSEKNIEKIVLDEMKGVPYYFEEKEDGTTNLYLYGNFNVPEDLLSDVKSNHYSSLTFQTIENGVVFKFVPYSKENIWGLDIIYSDNDAQIISRVKPQISEDVKKPLENLTVVLDPGHGGIDSGALGVLGVDGPMEKNLNLANAQLLKERLTSLGAKVVLTRETNDDNPTLLERADSAYLNNADIFISLHHNSIAEAADGNKYNGVEAYYYEDFGKKLAEIVPSKISENTALRDYRKTEWGYYVVTKIRSAPALLTEIGFMPSPVEYKRICSSEEIFKTSEAITASIMQLMQ